MGSICAKRSTTDRTPNSGAHDDHTAPRLAAARNATVVSGMFGRYAAMRSPRCTPNRTNPARHRDTAVRQLRPGELGRGARVWLDATTATSSGRVDAAASACSA